MRFSWSFYSIVDGYYDDVVHERNVVMDCVVRLCLNDCPSTKTFLNHQLLLNSWTVFLKEKA